MTLNEIVEMVKANPQTFPKGLETSGEDVKQYLAVVSVEPYVEKFANASALAVAVAENVGCKTLTEVVDAFDAASESLETLRMACRKAVASLKG